MTPEELKNAVLGIKHWSRGDLRALNKPLLMAYALAPHIQGHEQISAMVIEKNEFRKYYA